MSQPYVEKSPANSIPTQTPWSQTSDAPLLSPPLQESSINPIEREYRFGTMRLLGIACAFSVALSAACLIHIKDLIGFSPTGPSQIFLLVIAYLTVGLNFCSAATCALWILCRDDVPNHTNRRSDIRLYALSTLAFLSLFAEFSLYAWLFAPGIIKFIVWFFFLYASILLTVFWLGISTWTAHNHVLQVKAVEALFD